MFTIFASARDGPAPSPQRAALLATDERPHEPDALLLALLALPAHDEHAAKRDAGRHKVQAALVAAVVTPLPLPDDPRLTALIADWGEGEYATLSWPRAEWLHDFEAILREHHPDASSKRLTLTARLAAPFPLAKPGVP